MLDLLDGRLLRLQIGELFLFVFYRGARFIDLPAQIEIFLLRAVQLSPVIGDVLFRRRNGGRQRHALCASGGNFMLDVGQLLLRAAGVVFDFGRAAAERRDFRLRRIVVRHGDRRTFLHPHSDHHHQDDQNADDVDRHVEKRVGAERFMGFSMFHDGPLSVAGCPLLESFSLYIESTVGQQHLQIGGARFGFGLRFDVQQ